MLNKDLDLRFTEQSQAGTELQTESESELESEIKLESLDSLSRPRRGGKRGRGRKPRRHFSRNDQLVENDDELGIVKEGWLRISSKNFIKEHIYPKIYKPNFKPDYIDVSESSNFRVNSLYNSVNKRNSEYPPTVNSFWFRLSGRNLFYSHMKSNLEVLGSIPTHDIRNAEENTAGNKKAMGAFCFYIKDDVHSHWELCAETIAERMEWICKIRHLKKISSHQCDSKELAKLELVDTPVTVFERKVSQPIILIPQPNKFCNDNWNYNQNGGDWECDCAEGMEQSPINIETKKAIKSPVSPVFSYHEVEVKKTINSDDGQLKSHTYVKMENLDHMITIHAGFGSVVTLDGTTYNASKLVFHTPSEHKLDGKQYPMEMQIIHHGASAGALTKSVVLSFLFTKVPGVYNKFLDDLDFFSLPSPIKKEKKLESDLFIPKIFYNSDNEEAPIMKKFSFYTYQGSLTSPPCTQGTIHYVASDPIEIGTTALELFKEALRIPDMRDSKGNIIVSTASTDNNRRVMPLNGRNVYYFFVPKEEISELKKEYELVKKRPHGHYEKVIKKINNYYYVNNNKPSGMPGSLVVTESEAKGFD